METGIMYINVCRIGLTTKHLLEYDWAVLLLGFNVAENSYKSHSTKTEVWRLGL